MDLLIKENYELKQKIKLYEKYVDIYSISEYMNRGKVEIFEDELDEMEKFTIRYNNMRDLFESGLIDNLIDIPKLKK